MAIRLADICSRALALGLLVALAACASECQHTGQRASKKAKERASKKAKASGARPTKYGTKTQRAKRPVIIDSHVHITPLPGPMKLALRIFEAVGVEKFAVKSAGVPGTVRYAATRRFADQLGEKMAFFINLDWEGVDDPRWGEREADQLERAVRQGASGLKIFKSLGLGVRLEDGKLLKVDDPRLDPIFERAAKVGAIIAWHVADPVAFFEPVTPKNERYAELSMAPEWSFYGGDYPSHDELLAARDRVLAKHPKTTFLGIHMANYPENLDYVDKLLERCPNLYVDVSARIPEIGRHPAKKVRAFFVKNQDRILFGTDLIVTTKGMQLGSTSKEPPTYEDALEYYRIHRRFFETADEQFDHPTPIQGDWKIDGIDLPPKVLKKIYYENADRLIFAPRRKWLAGHRSKQKTPPRPAGQRPKRLSHPH